MTCILFPFYSEPIRGPQTVNSIQVNYTAYQITWTELPREVSNGVIKMYQVRLILKENCTLVQSIANSEFDSTFNTTSTSVLLTGLSSCSKYEVSVRGYTVVGPGPYSKPIVVQTLGE